MNRILILTIYLLFASIQSSIAQNWEWAKNYGGGTGDIGTGITTDQQGFLYVTGTFKDTIDFGTIQLISAGDQDVFVAKFDQTGNVIWAQGFGGAAMDRSGDEIILTANDYIYTIGVFYGEVIFDTIQVGSPGQNSIVIVKYNPSGQVQWVKSYVTSAQITGLSSDALNNVYASGNFQNSLIIESSTLISEGANDIFLMKLNDQGDVIWAIADGGVNSELANKMVSDNDGNSFLTGSFFDTAYFDTIQLVGPTALSGFTCKYDSAGSLVWAKSFNNAFPYDAGVDSLGNCFVTGHFSDSVKLGSDNLVSVGNADVFLSSIDSSGAFKWSGMLGSASSDRATSIYTSSSGTSYVAGYYESNLTDSSKAFVSKFEVDGQLDWTHFAKAVTNVGPGTIISANSIQVDNQSNIYTTGGFVGTAYFDADSIIATPYTNIIEGTGDVFIAKLNGIPLSIIQYENSNNLNISPNPSGGLITISADYKELPLSLIQVINLSGQVVYSKKLNGNLNESSPIIVDLSSLNKSVFLVQVVTDKVTLTEKIVIY